MADTATRIALDGYGQVELNQVAFRRDGRIEAQCKLSEAFNKDNSSFVAGHATFVENGMLLAIDPVAHTVGYPTANGAALLNYTTEHMYDERTPGLKNYKTEYGSFLPRLGYLAKGDKFTTNCVSFPKGDTYATEEAFWTAVGNCGTTPMYGHSSVDGSILVNATSTNAALQVVCGTTMPDGQKAVKFIAL